MKRRLKMAAKTLWRATFPLRRPVQHRFEAYLRRCLAAPPADESQVVLDHLIGELIRLQEQVERLRDAVEDLADRREALAVVADRKAG